MDDPWVWQDLGVTAEPLPKDNLEAMHRFCDEYPEVVDRFIFVRLDEQHNES